MDDVHPLIVNVVDGEEPHILMVIGSAMARKSLDKKLAASLLSKLADYLADAPQ
jgi:hypothetical protein